MILSSDTDKGVRTEVAYHIRFLCQELEESYIRKNVLKLIDNYLNDPDFLIRTAIITSILTLIPNKISDDFTIQNCVNKVLYIFDTESFNNAEIQRTQILIFKTLVHEVGRYGSSLDKYFNGVVKGFLFKHFLSKESTTCGEYNFNLEFDIIIEELASLVNLYKIVDISLVNDLISFTGKYVFEYCAKKAKEDHIFEQIFKNVSLVFVSNLTNVIFSFN